ncbi:MAG TPA: DNA-3-methyladenine glycosylase [Terriglobales bacterium]|nr:DNA-3-methyladenine glycosylase [Terriglobales bacterium]
MKHALEHLQRSDPVLGAIIQRVGEFRMEYDEPTFDTLVRSIIYQQLSGKAAATIVRRVVEACGGKLDPEGILALHPNKLRACGLSKQKLRYVRDLARHARNGELDLESLEKMEDAEVIAALTRVKGIGVWTAQMFLMFALRRPNVLPTGDLGVQNAIRRAYRKRKVTPRQVERIGKAWHPYCSIAAWYLWKSVDGAAQI